MQQIFIPFRGLTADELRNCDKLRQHGLRVMNTVDKCIARIDKPERLENILHELGHKHVTFNIKTDYLDVSRTNSLATILANDACFLSSTDFFLQKKKLFEKNIRESNNWVLSVLVPRL